TWSGSSRSGRRRGWAGRTGPPGSAPGRAAWALPGGNHRQHVALTKPQLCTAPTQWLSFAQSDHWHQVPLACWHESISYAGQARAAFGGVRASRVVKTASRSKRTRIFAAFVIEILLFCEKINVEKSRMQSSLQFNVLPPPFLPAPP